MSASADQLPLFGEQRAFVPPRGRGRCRQCGWHVVTQGHDSDCMTLMGNPRIIEPRMWLRRGREEGERRALAQQDAEVRGLPKQSFNPHGWFVYILWGDNPKRPLYVGKSTNVLQRLGTHMADADKRRLTKHIDVIRCGSKYAMNATEKGLIKKHRPILNVMGLP